MALPPGRRRHPPPAIFSTNAAAVHSCVVVGVDAGAIRHLHWLPGREQPRAREPGAAQASRGQGHFHHIQRLPVWRRRVVRDHCSCGGVVRVRRDALP